MLGIGFGERDRDSSTYLFERLVKLAGLVELDIKGLQLRLGLHHN
jgi:hypothetical protein